MLRSLAAVVFPVFFAGALCAQSTNASLSGSVTDPSKARIIGATVAAINSSMNVRTEARTNSAGEYYLPNLVPGAYRIEVGETGFKTLIRPEVILHVQDALTMDFQMTVGPTSESIRVEGGAPLVNTESATVSTVVDRTFVEDLPLNGRTFQTLILLTPGVVVTPTAFDDQGQFSVNGQRADANYFTVDGVSGNFGVTGYQALVQSGSGALPALSASGGTNSLVSVDAMQEFRVQTSGFAPEFGRTPGGQISIVTRSGTNGFRGTLFEYFRNDVLDAGDWFNGYTNNPPLPKAEERQNDFGGVFGGPILKDKTFFFFSYEGLRLRQPSTLETVVPDASSRQQAPASIVPYLNAYPIANGAEIGSGLAQFNGSYSNPSSLDAYSLRLDHVLNSKLTLFGRWDYSPSSLSQRAPISAFPDLSTRESESSSVQTATVGLTELISPRMSNEVRANYSNDRVGTSFSLDNFGGAVPLPESALYPAGFSSRDSFFEFLILGSGELGNGKYGIDEQRQVNLVDNFSLSKGSHQLRFGVDYRWLSPFTSPDNYAQFAEFTGLTSSPGGVLSGTAVFAQTQAVQGSALLVQNLSLYAQDTWKAAPRFELTYGIRWDLNPPLRGKNLANQPFTVTGLNEPPTIALAPRGTPLYKTTYGNVAPRVGFTYRLTDGPNWSSVLRGGFGIFYDLGSGSLGGSSSYFPFFTVNSFSLAPFPLSPQNAARPTPTINPPVSDIIVAVPDLKLPRTYQWNAAIEQSLGNRQSLSFAYIGAVGRDLLRVTDLISPNANFGFVNVTDNSATSDYNALQIKFQRNLSQGLQALASYTFSHSIDIASTDAYANYLNTPSSVANPNLDRGNSDFDIRHAFSGGVTYRLPSPARNNVAKAALGGWSVDSFIIARSAPPDDIVGGISFASGIALAARPDVIPGVPLVLYGSQYAGGKIFNGAAFTPAPAGQQGDFGRNVLRGFGATQADVGFQRQFDCTERLKVRFRGEFFNIFNNPNFAPPDNNITDALFGHSTATLASSLGSGGANGGLNPLYQIGGPRSIQLALKLVF
ncbi:MAG TPA: carboxypeptidase regulatory-like domain-containing protein [Candidatus Binatia bacterium]|nr:carboxypeptidase regulatory-like domain-containing protein [Candidatus Binatia bacterium]